MTSTQDIVVLTLASFFGNVGVAITGIGMGILFIFIWQISSMLGYDGVGFKYVIFIQSLSLVSVQPILLMKAKPIMHASRRALCYLIPPAVIFTPIGQWTGSVISTTAITAIGGVLVSIIALCEVFMNRKFFIDLVKCSCRTDKPSDLDRADKPSDLDRADKPSDPDPLDIAEQVVPEVSSSSNDFSEKYSISDDVLGEEGHSIVKKGTNLHTGAQFAIKIVYIEKLAQDELVTL